MKKYSPALKRISKIFSSIKREEQLKKLLEDCLTPAEILDIDERFAIVRELTKGSTQREVAKKLKVSVAKVTRGSHVLQYGTGGFEAMLKRKTN